MKTKWILGLVFCLLASGASATNSLLVTSRAAMGTSTAGSVCTGDTMAGPCGLSVLIDDRTPTYVMTTKPDSEIGVTVGFWVDPNGVVISPGDSTRILILRRSFPSVNTHGLVILRRHPNNSTYQLLIYQGDSATTFHVIALTPITDSPHYVEIDWLKSTAANNDGIVRVRLDGVQVGQKTNLNTSAFTVDTIVFGAFYFGRAANPITGEIYLDEFTVSRLTR